jgi:hypothetical protein
MEHTKTLPVKSRLKKTEVVAEAVAEAEVVEKPKRQRKKKVDQVEPVE